MSTQTDRGVHGEVVEVLATVGAEVMSSSVPAVVAAGCTVVLSTVSTSNIFTPATVGDGTAASMMEVSEG